MAGSNALWLSLHGVLFADLRAMTKSSIFKVGITVAALGSAVVWTCAKAGPSVADVSQRDSTVVGHSVAIRMAIDCKAKTHAINPMVYGIAYYPLNDAKDKHVWDLSPGARRWGGNHTSRFNWKLGNAWNTAADYYYRNVNYTGDSTFTWRTFLDTQVEHKVSTAMTLPMIGWVAKDTHSWSFPVSVVGAQQQVDPWHPDAGNGIQKNGKPVPSPAPQVSSVAMPPSDIEQWVRAIRAYDQKKSQRHVQLYLLDNEPGLWHQSHRDIHPEPVGYDELLERTIAYGSAVRRADPQAKIAGPAAWGWWEYFYSAKDQVAGFRNKPDRRAHGDVPLLAWYLRELAKYEKKTGTRVLDVLNVHYYPQDIPKGVDLPTQARRLRSTRALWDPTYKEESWVDDVVQLLPRLQALIDENYPGLGLMIGEYNFGGEGDMSGALAQAEALGRFTQHPNMTAAFYWSYPAANTPAFQAFRAFRNYDGKGAQFLENAVRTKAAKDASLFASRDASGSKLVVVALNKGQREVYGTSIDLVACGQATAVKTFQYTGGPGGFTETSQTKLGDAGKALNATLPAYSITVFEVSTARVAER